MSHAPPITPPPVPMAPAPTARVTKLCPHCLTENDPFAHMCRQCLTPMTFFAATVPVFSVWSEMNTYYKASHAPTKFLVVLGMWLIWGPIVLVYSLLAFDIFDDRIGFNFGGGFLPLIFLDTHYSAGILVLLPLALFICVPAILLVKTTRTYWGHKSVADAASPTAQIPIDELLRAALEAAPEGTEPGDVDATTTAPTPS